MQSFIQISNTNLYTLETLDLLNFFIKLENNLTTSNWLDFLRLL